MGGEVRLRALDPAGDRGLLERLWEAALAPGWPLLPGGLDLVEAGVVAERAGRPVGAVAVDPGTAKRRYPGGLPGPAQPARPGEPPGAGPAGQAAGEPDGGIPLLLVEPEEQGRGVGTGLLEAALERLREAGVGAVGLGSGGDEYLWPGVPEDLPGAVGFFRARGWEWSHTVIDLVADLRGYRAPDGVGERAAGAGVSIRVAGDRERDEVLAFEAAAFPEWLREFERFGGSMLVARDAGGELVGSLLFQGPPGATIYTPLLGPEAGTIGCVGVAEPARGAGVGSAMVARASELLAGRGTVACHIGWTQRERFYARVGYTPWRRYRMAARPLAAPAARP